FRESLAERRGTPLLHSELASTSSRSISGIDIGPPAQRRYTALAVIIAAAVTIAALSTGLLITRAPTGAGAMSMNRASDETVMPGAASVPASEQFASNRVSSTNRVEITLTGETIRFTPDQAQLSDSAKASLRLWLSENELKVVQSVRFTITGY